MKFSILVEYATMLEDSQLLKIGGTHADGIEWRLSAEKAISAIEEGRWNFHIMRNGQRCELVIVRKRGNVKELKVCCDKQGENSLQLLPACPPVIVRDYAYY